MRRRRIVPYLLATVLSVTAVSPSPLKPPATTADSEALPDLAMAPLEGFTIQWVNGRRLLRFTAMMINVGAGHFEVCGQRSSTSEPMRISQVIYPSASRPTASPSCADFPAGTQLVPTSAVGQWSGDGHDHWHVQEMMRYDLWGGAGTHRGAKIGFCFLDSDPRDLSLPGASGSPYYQGSWCRNTPSALSNRMGISIGWGDEYEYYLAWQWVDITSMPGGTYTVRAKVDPYGYFLEQNDENQCDYVQLSFSDLSSEVSVHERGSHCIDDWSGSPLGEHIAWMYDTGLTNGCGPELYCTYNAVTREQMAAFLDRALDLPATPNDYYADDDSSTFEISINRLAAAGIATGCGDGRFCPRRLMTRGEMAAFLSRALQLAATPHDYYTDDDSSTFEISINRLAAAGIATGCTSTHFCPEREVNRAEMAAFLHRAAPMTD